MSKIAIFGVNTLALEILKQLTIDIDLIVTIDSLKAEKLNVTDYNEKLVNYNNIQTYFVDKYSMKSSVDREYFNKYKGDIALVIGWNRLLPIDIINQFSTVVLGLHGTPYGLPKGRGRSPTIWTMVLGERKYHYYLFKITEGIDDGPIYSEFILDINSYDDNNSFHKKLAIAASCQINKVVPMIVNKSIIPKKQPRGEPTYFPKRSLKDGEINWTKSTNEIYNLIRAITKPYPCAHSYLNNKMFYIVSAIPFSTKLFKEVPPGKVCAIFEDKQFVVKTSDGSLLVKKYDALGSINHNDKFQNSLNEDDNINE